MSNRLYQLLTKLRSNAKNSLPLSLRDRILLRKRAIVESVIDQLKNISWIEHSRHRSVISFLVNLLWRLIAYIHQPKKLSLGRETLACFPVYPYSRYKAMIRLGLRRLARS